MAAKQPSNRASNRASSKALSASSASDKKQANKQAILAAASELFIEGGVSALSVREIAKRAKLSTIGIYSHFDGKQGILDALYVEGFERVIDALEGINTQQPAKTILRQGAKNYLRVASDYKAHYRLIFGEKQPGYEPSVEAQEVGARAFSKLNEWVTLVLPKGAKKNDIENAAMQLWSFMHGTASLQDHEVYNLVNVRRWQTRALDTLEHMLEGLTQTDPSA